ncbi:OmpA family protein [Geomonas subterranea]|uniref:OmpA family protein n=1 Tax=Geomonas subterranea TaxID=2847989 RepID=A0ABX8LN16_9BACT|nr:MULTISPECIES: OmpA family protein [Geomonas]QXE90930.1 OmpA family protein [Geomonas subterranea]QXM10984.1 OmpA family protein [Geomonas subterranea]
MTTAPKTLKAIDSFGLSPVVGGYYFSSTHALDPAPTYGVRVSYDHVGKGLIDSIGVEATFNYLSTTVKNSDKKATAYLFRTDAIYSFDPRSKWVPFLALGAGGIFENRDGARDSSPFLNFGVGIKYFFDDYLAVRADLRQLMVYNNVNTSNDFELTTGLTYYFGKERKKKAPPPPPPKPVIPVPQIVEEAPAATPATQEAPAVAAPPPDIVELLGATGAAALGLNTLPPQFQPGTAPQAQPKVPAQAYKSTLKQMPKVAAPPKAAPVAEPAPPVAKVPEAVPAPAPISKPAPVPVQPPAAVPPPAVAQAPQPAAPPQEPARQPQRSIRTLTIEFLFSSPAIRPIYQAQLAAFAALMKANTESTALIEGHTDNVGDSKSNLDLSQQRAQNVKNELLKHGVDPAKVTIKGYGFSKPRASNKTNEGRQKNRRAVVTLTLVITQ